LHVCKGGGFVVAQEYSSKSYLWWLLGFKPVLITSPTHNWCNILRQDFEQKVGARFAPQLYHAKALEFIIFILVAESRVLTFNLL
jgi:hypothetical protein